jgi:acetolactate synthase I/II/III large subunit
MSTFTGGGALVSALAAHGVNTVFGIPGTHNLPIYAELDEHGIRHVSPRHEQGAGYAADGYARVTGRPGVVVTTSGPALLNAATAAAQAYSDSVPVLLLSPGMPVNHPGRGNGELHECKDQSRAMDALVAYSHRITTIEEIPSAVAMAFAAMTGGRPRPVHLEVPLDVLAASASVTPVAPIAAAGVMPAASALDAAAAVLVGARRPGLLVGGGTRGAADAVRMLTERLGAPVVSTTNGKGVVPEDHPLAIGAGLHHPAVRAFVTDCDRVVAIGTELAPADAWEPLMLEGRLIRIDIDAAQSVRNAEPLVALVGDAALAIRGLLERLGDRSPDTDAATRAARWRERHHADAAEEGSAWLGLFDVLHATLDRETIVVGDSARVCYYGALSNLSRYTPASFLYPTGFGTLGYAIPAAIGAKLGRTETDVMALCGDGGVMFTVAELAAGAQLGLALPVVVVDNGGYGEIDHEMRARGQPTIGVGLPSIDLPAAARAFGCHGLEIEDLAALPAVLEAAFKADRPTMIRVAEALTGRRPQEIGAS